jgi:hypothetical protein
MAANKTKPAGRPPGAKNAIGGTAKENVIAVFNRLEGTAGMAKWAKRNPSDFYRLYAKLVPQQIDMEITERPCILSAEPLPKEDWDKQYGADRPN